MVSGPARPARLPVSKVYQLTDLRVSKPERPLYVGRVCFVKFWQRGRTICAAHSVCGGSQHYPDGVATGEAAGIGTALANV
jgi:hypothetical protein